MVLSYYFQKPLYCLAWHFLRAVGKTGTCILYCDDAFDAQLFVNVQRHLRPVAVVAKNRTVREALAAQGIQSTTLPAFPECVIMFRNMAWKFPCRKIIKIGFEHGAYNFKRFSKAHYYNLFNVFFMTSTHDVRRAEKRGITTAVAIGYPKIDSLFNGSLTDAYLKELASSIGLKPERKTLLFSATWDDSGMSAVHLWYDRLSELSDRFNIMVTLHPWVSEQFRCVVQATPGIFIIKEYNLLPYIQLSDVCISDTTSLIAEFCLLRKPTVTFRLPPTPRTMPDVIEMIEKISVRIDSFEELTHAVDQISEFPEALTKNQTAAVERFFDTPDGKAGQMAADRIIGLMPRLAP